MFLTIYFYPGIPRTSAGWVALFFLGLPAWVLMERLGKLILNSNFFGNLSSGARILLGVPTVVFLFVGAYLIVSLVHYSIDAVGG